MCSTTERYHKSLTRKVEERLLDDEQAPPPPTPSKPRPLPMHRDVLAYHARQLARKRRTRSTAEAFYRRMLDQDRSDARAWIGLGRLQAKKGSIDEARITFKEGVGVARTPHLLQAWGVVEERNGNVTRAGGLFRAAVKMDNAHVPSWVSLGLWHQRQCNTREAARCFCEGATVDPANYYVWHAWGVLERERGNYAAARKCFRKGIDANPKNAATYVVWGSLEAALGHLNVAQSLYRKAHKYSPRNVHALVSHAAAAERGGQTQRARVLLERARVVRPRDPAPVQALALLEARHGDVQQARQVFKEAVKICPKHAPSWHAWACLECEVGDIARARELFQQAIWCSPDHPDAARCWHSWAQLELRQGAVETARRYVGHGLRVKRDSPPLLSMLATIEAAAGGAGVDRARELFEAAVKESPRRRVVWQAYESMERAAGHPRRAVAVHERARAVFRLVDERLPVADAQAGDFASTGTWLGPDDLRGQDVATVRYVTQRWANGAAASNNHDGSTE